MAKGLALAVVATLAMSVLATTATGRATFSSTVTILNETPGDYRGEVKSSKGKCKKKRDITVYHDDDSNGVDPGDFEIGSTRTNRKGFWAMTGEEQAPAGDTVIAVAAKKKKRSTVCKEAEGSTSALSR